ncbi:MAG TPA: biotin--[acetyl-CoA-carboxylase] ligase [Acidimicrobiales bacterium]|nr:biotin--[acetyl-CoA-carboxylase] ligase [Acidimicrobiales bacterium]
MTDPRPRTFTDVRWFSELGSTNTWLLAAAEAGIPEGTVVVADRQSAGRGRLGRRWESAPGSGLLTSLLFRPRLEPGDLFSVAALAALAARDAIGAIASVKAGVKWPNDLVVEDAKLAGVLSETRGAGTAELAVVVGIGINVSWPMPGREATELNATCLDALAGRPVDRKRLLEALLDAVEARHPRLDDAAGRAGLIRELESCTVTIGRRVRVELPEETFSGTAVSLDELGHLVVDADGNRRVVSAADVVHLRE